MTPLTPTGGITHYAKGITALLGVGLALQLAARDGLTVTEASTLAIAFLGAVTAYLFPNLPTGIGRYAKGIIMMLTAVATVLPTYLAGWDGLTREDWALTATQVITAALVVVVPNAKADLDALRAAGLEHGVLDTLQHEPADTTGSPLGAPGHFDTGLLPAVTATSVPADLAPAPVQSRRMVRLRRTGGGS